MVMMNSETILLIFTFFLNVYFAGVFKIEVNITLRPIGTEYD